MHAPFASGKAKLKGDADPKPFKDGLCQARRWPIFTLPYMYRLPPDQWKEIPSGRRWIASLAGGFPGSLRLKFCALPAGVISVNEGNSVEPLRVASAEGLYRLPRGVAWSRGAHLDKNARIVEEVSPGVNRPAAWWMVRRQKFFPKFVKCPGTVFSMLGDDAVNLYHWTFDVLPRLRWIEPARRREVRVLARLTHPFHRSCLEAAGFPPAAIIPADSMTFYQTDELLVAQVVKGVTPENLAFAREIYLKAAGPARPSGAPLRLYISRANATSRRIVNEDEVLRILEPQGFTVVQMEKLSLAKQLALFRDAESIVAPTGAALAHLHLCQSGVKLMILMPEGCDDFLYRDMARTVGLAPQLLNVPLAPGSADDPVKADLLLDRDCLDAVRAFAG